MKKNVVRIKHHGEHEITTIKITMIDNNKNNDDFAWFWNYRIGNMSTLTFPHVVVDVVDDVDVDDDDDDDDEEQRRWFTQNIVLELKHVAFQPNMVWHFGICPIVLICWRFFRTTHLAVEETSAFHSAMYLSQLPTRRFMASLHPKEGHFITCHQVSTVFSNIFRAISENFGGNHHESTWCNDHELLL